MPTPGVLVKKRYLINTPAGARSVLLPDYYDSINTNVGLSTPAAGNNAQTVSMNDLAKYGHAAIITISQKLPTGRYRRTRILCDWENVSAALTSLIGQTYNGLQIKGAYFAKRRRLG